MKKQLAAVLLGFTMISLSVLADKQITEPETTYFNLGNGFHVEIMGETVYLDPVKLDQGVVFLQDKSAGSLTMNVNDFVYLLEDQLPLQASQPFGESYSLIVTQEVTCLNQPCPYTNSCACNIWFYDYLPEHCQCFEDYPYCDENDEVCKTNRRNCIRLARQAYLAAIKAYCVN
ncbi:MAG: hypothetical protein QNK37_35900 [Acidobacteriota bacterium]|nr:hypothetical protein [Acidobacteriota bacterium]